ncbi:MAG: amidohydrolase family protein [Nitrososphaerota archaeon]|nr:amidohydrolase family protein [Nitrososphaerota archaeon]
MNRSVDCHIHLSQRPDDLVRRYAKLNGLEYTLDELASEMRGHGVEHGLLLSPPTESGGILPNEDVLEICRRSEGLLSPIVTVEPTEEEAKAALKLAEEHRKVVKGFKVRLGYVDAAADSPVFGSVYDYAEAEGLPVLFHTGDTATSDGDLTRSHPLALDALANEREELTMVACHFGNPWMDDTAELIYKHPKVYADTSGLTTGGGTYGRKLAELLARRLSEAAYFAGGGEKILFGTDYPVTRYEDALGLIDMMEVDDSDKERILWRNAKEVFGL